MLNTFQACFLHFVNSQSEYEWISMENARIMPEDNSGTFIHSTSKYLEDHWK